MQVKSAVLDGVAARLVDVEAKAERQGMPGLQVKGLREAATKEAKVRCLAAIRAMGLIGNDPMGYRSEILVSGEPRESSHLDLAMAAAMLVEMGVAKAEHLKGWLVVGELDLGGKVRSVRGLLPMIELAKAQGLKVVCPLGNAKEAAQIKGVDVVLVSELGDVTRELTHYWTGLENSEPPVGIVPDYSDLRGQSTAIKALEEAVLDGHDILLVGPPAAGKTMLAKRLPTIMAPMTFDEQIEATRVYSVSGLLHHTQGRVAERPFRAPHHTISTSGLVGTPMRPGEVSLAHQGVLFLDDMHEFRREALDHLWAVRKAKTAVHYEAGRTIHWPAHCTLVAAITPCPCGYLGSQDGVPRACTCTPHQVARHRERMAPYLSTFKTQINVPIVRHRDIVGGQPGEASAVIRERIAQRRLAANMRALPDDELRNIIEHLKDGMPGYPNAAATIAIDEFNRRGLRTK